MVKMYIIDIGGARENLEETDEFIAEEIFLHRDLIRGFTLNPIIISMYRQYMSQILGKYVVLETFTFDVEEGLTTDQYTELALKFYKVLVEEAIVNYACTCPEIYITELENGGYVMYTEAMMDYSMEVYQYEDIIYENLIKLGDDVLYYTNLFNYDESMVQFMNLILSGIKDRAFDFFGHDGRWYIDPYAVLHHYIETLRFTY